MNTVRDKNLESRTQEYLYENVLIRLKSNSSSHFYYQRLGIIGQLKERTLTSEGKLSILHISPSYGGKYSIPVDDIEDLINLGKPLNFINHLIYIIPFFP